MHAKQAQGFLLRDWMRGMMSAKLTYFPGDPGRTSATKKGCTESLLMHTSLGRGTTISTPAAALPSAKLALSLMCSTACTGEGQGWVAGHESWHNPGTTLAQPLWSSGKADLSMLCCCGHYSRSVSGHSRPQQRSAAEEARKHALSARVSRSIALDTVQSAQAVGPRILPSLVWPEGRFQMHKGLTESTSGDLSPPCWSPMNAQ